ncbi:MAG: 3-hydroxyacyl-[acyl-carrier-protein] dehydratase FabZ [Planctomycetota bacterium]|nr:MAG: 3-hydroxyacyl-[acyl-carrier-protein] dehydratase FabZ [Planctomycetota bacterium]
MWLPALSSQDTPPRTDGRRTAAEQPSENCHSCCQNLRDFWKRKMRVEQTLADATEWIEGEGLHTGARCRCRILPAPEGSGIVFCRRDADMFQIPAHIDYAANTTRFTMLQKDGISVMTVEHLLCALYAMRVDNAVVEIEGEEVPDLDGAALAFYNLLRKTGVKKQCRVAEVLFPTTKIVVEEDEGRITVEPSGGFEVRYVLHYQEGIEAEVCFDGNWRRLVPARTFCLQNEVEQLRAAGYGKGAKEGAVLVLDGRNKEDNEEAAKHKIIDFVGDMTLLGREVRGRFICERSGHRHNRRLCRMLADGMKEQKRQDVITAEDVMRVLPHRYPFLMVDKVLYMEAGRRAVGVKNVTINEPYFPGHFPTRPVMPGVLQIEAMAQLAGVLLLRDVECHGKLPFLMSIDGVKFRRPVVPGDQLVLEAEVVKMRSRSGEVATRALVDGKVVSEARIKFVIVEQGGNDGTD